MLRYVPDQVNIASREAAVAPTLIDGLAEYAGAYNTVFQAGPEGDAPRPLELTIAPGKAGARPAASLPAFSWPMHACDTARMRRRVHATLHACDDACMRQDCMHALCGSKTGTATQ
jgi:hypothetical protein